MYCRIYTGNMQDLTQQKASKHMLIIKAGKKESGDKQKLISSLNHSGLWLITEQA